jgi:hypothetical protein
MVDTALANLKSIRDAAATLPVPRACHALHTAVLFALDTRLNALTLLTIEGDGKDFEVAYTLAEAAMREMEAESERLNTQLRTVQAA